MKVIGNQNPKATFVPMSAKVNQKGKGQSQEGQPVGRKAALKKQRERIVEASLTKLRNFHKHLTVISWDSPEMKNLMSKVDMASIGYPEEKAEDSPHNPYALALAIERGKVIGKPSMVHRSHEVTGLTPEAFLEQLRKVAYGDKNAPEGWHDIERSFEAKFGGYTNLDWNEWDENVFKYWRKPIGIDAALIEVELDKLAEQILSVRDHAFGDYYDAHDTEQRFLPVLAIEDAWEHSTKNANSGMPFFTSSWNSNFNAMSPKLEGDANCHVPLEFDKFGKHKFTTIPNYYIARAMDCLNPTADTFTESNGLYLGPLDPTRILFSRVQPKGKEVKMRPIMNGGKSESILAKAISMPLVYSFKYLSTTYGFWGGDQMYQAFYESDILGPNANPEPGTWDWYAFGDDGALIYVDGNGNTWFVEVDFAEFDTYAAVYIPFFFKLLKRVFPAFYSPLFDYLEEYYKKAELLTPIGLLKCEDPEYLSGLCSGDGLTSVIGTTANLLATGAVIELLKEAGISPGDPNFLETLSGLYSRFGLKVNADKTKVSNKWWSFLGFHYNLDMWREACANTFNNVEGLTIDKVALYPIMRLSSGLYYMEFMPDIYKKVTVEEAKELGISFKDVKNTYALETLAWMMKLHNCRNLPNFKEIVECVAEMHTSRLNPIVALSLDQIKAAFATGKSHPGGSLINFSVTKILLQLHNINEDNLEKVEFKVRTSVFADKLIKSSTKYRVMDTSIAGWKKARQNIIAGNYTESDILLCAKAYQLPNKVFIERFNAGLLIGCENAKNQIDGSSKLNTLEDKVRYLETLQDQEKDASRKIKHYSEKINLGLNLEEHAQLDSLTLDKIRSMMHPSRFVGNMGILTCEAEHLSTIWAMDFCAIFNKDYTINGMVLGYDPEEEQVVLTRVEA